VGKISFANRQTVYETYGDIFGWMIVASAIVLLAYNFHLKEKSPFKYCENCRAKMKKDTEKCEECGESTKKHLCGRGFYSTNIMSISKNKM